MGKKMEATKPQTLIKGGHGGLEKRMEAVTFSGGLRVSFIPC